LPKELVDHIVDKIDKIIEKHQLTKPAQSLVNRRNDNIKNQVIADVVFEYKHLLENMIEPEDVDNQRQDTVKFIKAFESLRGNNILDHLPEYEEFLRSYGY
jgi:hypothetical protein